MIETAKIEEIFKLIKSERRKEGIELLYSIHYNKLYGIAFLFSKNETDTEDIVHNAIVKLFTLPTELLPKAYESTWLYTFVKNEALMYLRKEKPTVSIDSIPVLVTEDQKIENYVNMDAYYSIIKDLSEEKRQIVTLKILGGFTHKEIAAMLGKPIGTVQWLYNTSIRKLKYILSSIIISVFMFGFGLISRIYLYTSPEYTPPVPGGDTSGAMGPSPIEPSPDVPFDYWIIIFAVLILLGIMEIFVFIKKFKIIPTKAYKKNI